MIHQYYKLEFNQKIDIFLLIEELKPLTEISDLHDELQDSGVSRQKMISEIHDIAGNHIATVQTYWQIKSWNRVKTKLH